ncbi:MAG TPA: hypothetical protein VF516_03200 [Kofleriaceae bacterium]
MTWVAAAVGGGAIVSGLLQSNAAKSAAGTQANAANQAAQTQLQMFNTVNDQNAPYRGAGNVALADILYGFGQGPNPSAGGAPYTGTVPTGADQFKYISDPSYRQAFDSLNEAHTKQYGIAIPASADPSMVAQQVQAYGYNPNTVTAAPGAGAVQTGSNDIGGLFTHQFNAADLNSNLAPNYQFTLDQGLGATRNAANLQTGLVSGNALKGIADYTVNKAGDAYQNAFNNFTTNQNNIFNRLSTVAGFGSGANQVTANAGTTTAGNVGSAQLAGGAAQAAGDIGSANALAGGISNAASWYALPKILNNGGAGPG